MDFFKIITRSPKKGVIEILPNFIVRRSTDLMVRGKSFYAIWDEEKGLWSTDEYDVVRLVDAELREFEKRNGDFLKTDNIEVRLKTMESFSSKMWSNYRSFLNQVSDNSHQLDNNITFSNTEVKKTDYISKRLPYPLQKGSIEAYDELMSVIFEPKEREKLEWAIGAIISGDTKKRIQKFIVLHGDPGTGKSTFLDIVQKLFNGYCVAFEAKALVGTNNIFSTEVFRHNPLVAIQHDGDLSKIEDNTKLNSIVSHETITVNEKHKSSYDLEMNAFLFMGTNKPVQISDAKSGIIRRLIDVYPSGRKIPPNKYFSLRSQIDFELGAIAHHCLEVYRKLGRNYYTFYKPLKMIYQTDTFFNFVEANYSVFKNQGGIGLSQAYEIYKRYCEEAMERYILPRRRFREELKSYFKEYHDRTRVDGQQIRNYYWGFLSEKFREIGPIQDDKIIPLVLDSDISLLDDFMADYPAQYATENEKPLRKWDEVKTTVKDLKTNRLHYVKGDKNHIVIDFDLRDRSGKKSLELNLEAASKWPSTYAELSKSGGGIHLHYIYDGDTSKLSRIYDDGIEIKIFSGRSSLRRKLTKCNNVPIAVINSGLPMKGEKPVINLANVKSEHGLRGLIVRNLNKDIHPGTKPSVDFIYKILDDAYKSGMKYDISDMRPAILAFANNSTNQSEYCVKLVARMKFASDEPSASVDYENDEVIFFDVEVFPNLFVLVWKPVGKDKVIMFNPEPKDIEPLFKRKLIGFNNRRYDNHILYARYIGYDNQRLYELSQRIINQSRNAFFGEAYNISYTDVYDFASAGNKMGLKRWQVELGIYHMELGFKWDEPVPKEFWKPVGEYCGNDVDSTEAVFFHLSGDWAARQILAELSGLTVNDTTNAHSTKIVFGNNRKPELVYTDLSVIFPGYKFENGVSTYRGVIPGEGGYVYAEPGMYTDVAVLDVASMHPTSIEQLNLFGEYTKNYSDLKKGRLAIKHKDFDILKTLLGGRLIPFIEDALSENPRFTLKDVSNGLKTALNSAYGLTSAGFPNPFRDPRNKDNIVAKRGALFMIDLQHAVQERGFQVVHIKTDSIKIPNATQEIIDFIFEFGRKYGYVFEHESTYSKFCLVNNAVYIAKNNDKWEAVGAQFAHPYVFKTLFSREPVIFEDMCETKSVTTVLYLDMNEDLGPDEHNYRFVGKTSSFCPMKPGCGGGVLLRQKNDKYYAATGTKGYRWLEAGVVRSLGNENDIDKGYFNKLVDEAVKDISAFGDFEWFVGEEPIESLIGIDDIPPPCWEAGNGDGVIGDTCAECSLSPTCDVIPF